MCGIVYHKSFNNEPANNTIIERFQDQRSRGSDGFGFFNPDTNRLTHNPREGQIRRLLRNERKATELLFHHRFPTSTENTRNGCHPYSTKDYFSHNYVLVHNGVLWNEHALKLEHDAIGIQYVSEGEDGRFNDSEALTYDVARYLEGHTSEIKAEGSIAFICIKRDHKGKKIALYFGRNSGNPLVMHKTKKGLTLSSEGKGTLIDTNTLYCYDYSTGTITKSFCEIKTSTRYTSSNYYGNYPSVYGADYEEVEEYNRSFGLDAWGNPLYPTSKNTAEYFSGWDREAEHKSKVKAVQDRLLSDAYYSNEDAVMLGEMEIEGIKKKHSWLLDLVEVWDQASDSQLEEYNRVESKIALLQQAIEAIQKEVSGYSQMGFQYQQGIRNIKQRMVEETGIVVYGTPTTPYSS